MPNVDPVKDCCVHGGVYLKFDDRLVSDGAEDWTVSTAAFNFLRSIFRDHPQPDEEALIPCCGFTMWIVDSVADNLYMPNCNRGIDWTIKHSSELITHSFPDGASVVVSLKEWTAAVCSFADKVHEFFSTAWPKQIPDDDDRKGFELFLKLWSERRVAAQAILDAS